MFASPMLREIALRGKDLTAVGAGHLGRTAAVVAVTAMLVQGVGVLVALAAHLAFELLGGRMKDDMLAQVCRGGECLVARGTGVGAAGAQFPVLCGRRG